MLTKCIFRKLTEADLDEADPLYRDRASVMRQDEIVESDEEMDNTVIKCIMDHFERIKLLLLEAIMDWSYHCWRL